MRSTRELGEPLPSGRFAVGLPEDATAEHDLGVDPEDDHRLPSGDGARPRLPFGVLKHDLGGIPLGDLLDLGDDDVERHPDRTQELPTPR